MDRSLFSWLHLSDAHFGHVDPGHTWDQKLVLDRLKDDIREQMDERGVLDAIFITGDIAFGGQTEQYRDAFSWISALAEIAKVEHANIVTVPGNHDVCRAVDTENSGIRRLVKALRAGTEDIDAVLKNTNDESLLVSRKRQYIEFTAAFSGMQSPHPFFWTSRQNGRGSLRVRIVGLDSALVAADNDDKGHLRLGKQAFARTLTSTSPNELVIVLSHHPFRGGWLGDEHEAESELKSRAHIHLSGHIHEAESEDARSGSGASIVRISAGAIHGDKVARGVPSSHGYNFGAVLAKAKKTTVFVWPRRWSDRQRKFLPDLDSTKDEKDYSEHPLSLRLDANLSFSSATYVSPPAASSVGKEALRPFAASDASRAVLLAWTGQRGRALASLLASYLPRILPFCIPRMTNWQVETEPEPAIGTSQEANTYFGVLCVTPEQTEAPWLAYQAGALGWALGKRNTCALLLGSSPEDISGPLASFTKFVVSRTGLFEFVQTANKRLGVFEISEDLLRHRYDGLWPDLERSLEELVRIKIPGDHLAPVLKAFARRGFLQPVGGDQVFFVSGFESHDLYSTLTETAKTRLCLFGRKNRKFFDKEHQRFFDQLADRIRDGFRFQVLFLDPDAPDHVISGAHRDPDLRDQLRQGLARAASVLESAGLTTSEHVRLYNFHRTMSIVVADQAVLFSSISVDSSGRARHLTKAPFEVLSAQSEYGSEIVRTFEVYWQDAKPWVPDAR